MKPSLNKTLLFFAIIFCNALVARYESPEYVRYANEIIKSFIKDMYKEFGLIAEADGGGMPQDVELFVVNFVCRQRATIHQACELEVKVTERFLEKINNNLRIRPYLRDYPFKAPGAQVSISFNQLNGEPYTDGIVVGHVFQVKDFIFYCKRGRDGHLSHLGEELYEDALRIVQNPHLKLKHDLSKHWSAIKKREEVKDPLSPEEEQDFLQTFDTHSPYERWEQLKAIAENRSRMRLSEGIRELIAGLTEPYFEESLQQITELEKSDYTGEYVEYWDNGQIKIKAALKNGWAHGHIHGWLTNGCDAFKAYFDEGVKQGVHIAFFPLNRPSRVNYQRVLSYNEKGRAHGEQKTKYPRGGEGLESIMCYKNGVLNGEMEIHGKGLSNLLEERKYAKGKLIEQKIYPPKNIHSRKVSKSRSL